MATIDEEIMAWLNREPYDQDADQDADQAPASPPLPALTAFLGLGLIALGLTLAVATRGAWTLMGGAVGVAMGVATLVCLAMSLGRSR